jgi:hypothetical protein
LEALHAGRGDGVVGDGHEAGVGALEHFVERVAEALDVIVVERRVDFVEHADRREVGESQSSKPPAMMARARSVINSRNRALARSKVKC